MKILKGLYVILFYKILFSIFKLFPINDKKVTFISYAGKNISGNPKAILQYVIENMSEKKCVVAVRDKKEKYNEYHGKNVKLVKCYGIGHIYNLATSKYWISNSHINPNLKPKKDTIYLQTWHAAGAFKKFGLDIIEDRSRDKEDWIIDSTHWNKLICSSDRVSDIYAAAFDVQKDIIVSTGLPRNDVLFDEKRVNQVRADFRIKYGIEKKIVLYAPTFRDGERFNLNMQLDILKKQLNEEYNILIKLHPNNSKELKISDEYRNFAYNFTEYNETQELLMVADILITDYSSIIFDYAILKRPMIFYAYDLDKYKNETRGFYYEYEEFVPGPIAYSTQEVISHIKNIEYDSKRYENKSYEFAKEFNYPFDGKATERVAKLLL